MKTKDCDGSQFLLAVYDVYLENEDPKTWHERPKGGAEAWTLNSDLRRELWERTREKYCERTGCRPHEFWFSEDGVAVAYIRWRKQSENECVEAAKALATGLPL